MADGRDLFHLIFHNQKKLIGSCNLLVENLRMTVEKDGRNCSILGSFWIVWPERRMVLFELRKTTRIQLWDIQLHSNYKYNIKLKVVDE